MTRAADCRAEYAALARSGWASHRALRAALAPEADPGTLLPAVTEAADALEAFVAVDPPDGTTSRRRCSPRHAASAWARAAPGVADG
jgi:hypothetical protein